MPGLTERLLYRVAKRWIAGYSLEDAINVAHDANNRKLRAILNRLGEHTPDEKLIQSYTEEYLKLLDRIQAEKIDGTISVKPSQIGLAANPSLYKTNLLRIIERAENYHEFVWIDMENSPYTEATVKTYLEILPSHRRLGVCLQANMKRTESDLQDIIAREGIVRLVKGAYLRTLSWLTRREAMSRPTISSSWRCSSRTETISVSGRMTENSSMQLETWPKITNETSSFRC